MAAGRRSADERGEGESHEGGRDGAELHASTLSLESGYYLFKAVKPGEYLIVIPDQESARLDAAPAQPLRVVMPEGGEMVSGQDFLLERAAALRTLEAAASLQRN